MNLVPIVVEQTNRGEKRAYDGFSPLLKRPDYFHRRSDYRRQVANLVIAQLLFWRVKPSGKIFLSI